MSIAILALAVFAALISGCGSDKSTASEESLQDLYALEIVEQDALSQYKRYLEGETRALAGQAEALRRAIAAKDFSNAMLIYGQARVRYNHLLPGAPLVGGAASQIDAGLDEIERAIFGREEADGLEPVAEKLVADVRELHRKLAQAELGVPEIGQGTGRLMEEVSTRMILGKEEPNSRIDLVDVSAAVEGAARAFEALRPRLANQSSGFVLRAEAQALKAFERLAEHGGPAREFPVGQPGSGGLFVPYGDLSPEEIRQVGDELRELEGLYRELPSRLQPPEGLLSEPSGT